MNNFVHMINENELQGRYSSPVMEVIAVESLGVIADSGGGAGGDSGDEDTWE